MVLGFFNGFVPRKNKYFFANLVSSAPNENIVPFKDLDIVEFPPPPPKAPKKKGKAKNTATQVFFHLVT
jgi:hypothetical protein